MVSAFDRSRNARACRPELKQHVEVVSQGDALARYYGQGLERERLRTRARGRLEFERSKEIIQRSLPAPPCVVADVGGGPGAYALWLAELGYTVVHRDVVPLHVEQLREDGSDAGIDTAVGDARALDLGDGTVDAMLLLGPLYHLAEPDERHAALCEARRVVRPEGFVYAAAISRWATRLDALLVKRVYRDLPQALELIDEVERTGILPPLGPNDFVGYMHRPEQFRAELAEAGLVVDSLLSVEGAGALMVDIEDRASNEQDWSVILDAARATEAVPELLGVGPHLIATCRRPR